MKKLLVLAGILCFAIGCGSSEPKSVAEGVEMSDIEKYEQMAAESMKGYAEGADAEEAAGGGPKS